jgi:hypothetical protein
MNSVEIKNRIKKIIRNRTTNDDSNSEDYLQQIANFIYQTPHDVVSSLQIAKQELKSPNLYDKLENHLAATIANKIFDSVSVN